MSNPAASKWIPALNVGVAQTFGGGLAIGGDGKWSDSVKAVARRHGMRMSKTTGEWYCDNNTLYSAVLADLEAA